MVGLGGEGPDEARSTIVEGEGAVPGGQKPTDGLFFFWGGAMDGPMGGPTDGPMEGSSSNLPRSLRLLRCQLALQARPLCVLQACA